MKYQFCIRFDNVDAHSAASKAVLDCNQIFREAGYLDYTFTVADNTKKFAYYISLLWQMLKFYFSIKPKALVGIQYPLLSVNTIFKYFIKIARLKGARFFCIVHDVESLRTGGKDADAIKKDIDRLNQYDQLIVHNEFMMGWLRTNGLTTPMISLELFDYLSTVNPATRPEDQGRIAYAGNIIKSTFVYGLQQLNGVGFNIYGPGFKKELLNDNSNLRWLGQFGPDEIPNRLSGSFGLIWDGTDIDKCDDILGNYLKYNNPHKFSLYIAAGMPVIAPRMSAIASFITQHGIGVLVDSLRDLKHINVTDAELAVMRTNLAGIRQKVIAGVFFREALYKVENAITTR